MTPTPSLRRRVLFISLAVAAAAWIVLILAMHFRVRESGAVVGAAVGWPLVYAACLGMCWFLTKFVGFADESTLYGPRKDLQLKLVRGLGVWWINAVTILFPAAVFTVALLGLCGVIAPVE